MEEVTCELQYSRGAEAFLALAVGATLAIVVLTPFPDWARALLFAWVVGGATRARHWIRRLRGLKLDRDGCLALRFEGGEWVRAVLRPRSFVAPWLAVVRWRREGDGFDRTSLVLADAVNAETFRKLRVLLRHGHPVSSRQAR